MSRIQNILDKAEREGAVRRIRPLSESVVGVAPPALASTATASSPVASSAAPPGVVSSVAVSEAAVVPTQAAIAEAVGMSATTTVPMPPHARLITSAQLDPRLVATTAANGVAAEQYRALRTRIAHTNSGGAINVVLVTSPGRGEGKSLTVANLGLTMAQEYQQRICVVDADLRAPEQAALFGVPEAPGLTDVLIGNATLDEALIRIEEHQITLLPAGNPAAHPAELLCTAAMRRMLDTLRSRFDRVVIDVPAAMPLADVGILSPLADSVLLVIRAGLTSKPSVHEAVSAIDPGKLLGFVLNEATA